MKSKNAEKPDTVITPEGLTAKEIYDSCNNRTDFGKELLRGDLFKSHKFWDTEKTREMTITIPSFISYAGSSYNEILEYVREINIPTVAEVLWMLKTNENFYDRFHWKNDVCYTWTSTKTDDGYYAILGYSGCWDSDGPYLSRGVAGYLGSHLGLGFSCIASGTDETTNDDPKEAGQADWSIVEFKDRVERKWREKFNEEL